MSQASQNMVLGWIGRMGSGKTLNMTKWALLFSDALSMPLYANYHINGGQVFHDFKDLENKQDIIVAYDEIHVDHDSRDWNNKTRWAFTHWFTQLRKKGIIFLYTTQNTDALELRVRRHTDYMFWCYKSHSKGHLIEIVYDTQMSLENALYCKTITNIKPELLYHLYDTHEIISEHVYQEK